MEDETTKPISRRAEIEYLLDTKTPSVNGLDEDVAHAQVLALLEIADEIEHLTDELVTMARWFAERR